MVVVVEVHVDIGQVLPLAMEEATSTESAKRGKSAIRGQSLLELACHTRKNGRTCSLPGAIRRPLEFDPQHCVHG